jgi:hypothetical protein
MNSSVCRLLRLLAVVLCFCGASSAYADSYQITFTSGLTGALNLTGSATGPGSFLVTGLTGSENGMGVAGLIAPNSSGVYTVPDGNGFAYDDLLFPSTHPVFDNAGLLFMLDGPAGVIFENLYSVGSTSYLESAYLSNGSPFPGDFSYIPVTFSLSKLPPSKVEEPASVVLCLVGLMAVGFLKRKKKQLA